jgi:hypothetical protein
MPRFIKIWNPFGATKSDKSQNPKTPISTDLIDDKENIADSPMVENEEERSSEAQVKTSDSE